MTNDEFDRYFEEADLFNEYMEYIMENADPSERMICNGDSLVVAAEEGYLYEAFRDHWIAKNS